MRIYPTRMSIITVMQTPADATKPHEKKKETRGISKKHTRRHTLPNLFVSLPLVPLFYYYYFFFVSVHSVVLFFFLPEIPALYDGEQPPLALSIYERLVFGSICAQL